MALAHKTIISGLAIERNGNASVRIGLLIVDGSVEFQEDFLRVPITKGENLSQKATQINAILTSMGRQTLNAHEANVIGNTLTACWAAMDA